MGKKKLAYGGKAVKACRAGKAKMEKLLAPIIECCEEYITGKEVLDIP